MEKISAPSNFTANDYITTLIRLGNERLKKLKKVFEIDNENEKQINLIAEYFLGIENELNQEKGLFILGNPGSGKSIIFELTMQMMFFSNTPKIMKDKSFKMESCEEIAVQAKKEGESILYQFKKGIICFDDLGDEDIKKNWGDRINSMYVVIKQRYKYFWKNNLVTHFTTNLSKEDFINMYGVRSYSRMKEMCNIIELSGKDRRLK